MVLEVHGLAACSRLVWLASVGCGWCLMRLVLRFCEACGVRLFVGLSVRLSVCPFVCPSSSWPPGAACCPQGRWVTASALGGLGRVALPGSVLAQAIANADQGGVD